MFVHPTLELTNRSDTRSMEDRMKKGDKGKGEGTGEGGKKEESREEVDRKGAEKGPKGAGGCSGAEAGTEWEGRRRNGMNMKRNWRKRHTVSSG